MRTMKEVFLPLTKSNKPMRMAALLMSITATIAWQFLIVIKMTIQLTAKPLRGFRMLDVSISP